MKTIGSIINNTNTDDLSERITIQAVTLAQDGEGNITRAYDDRCTLWAKVLPIQGDITDANNETHNKVLYRVTVRYNPDIQPTDRVIWRGRALMITSTPYDAESRHIWTVFDCVEWIEYA